MKPVLAKLQNLTVQCIVVQCNQVQYTAVQCNPVQCIALLAAFHPVDWLQALNHCIGPSLIYAPLNLQKIWHQELHNRSKLEDIEENRSWGRGGRPDWISSDRIQPQSQLNPGESATAEMQS